MTFGFIGEITETDSVVWKTEGLTDALAILSLEPPAGHTATCNACGAGERPDKSDVKPYLNRMAGKEVFVVHDCDVPGQEGAMGDGKNHPGWANVIACHAETARNVVLPYEIAPNHGKDVRDWIGDQRELGKDNQTIYAELIDLARATQAIDSSGITITTQDDEPGAEPDDDDEMKADDGRPLVELQNDEAKVSRDVVACLSNLGWNSPWLPESDQETAKLFVRAGKLTQVIERENADGVSELVMRTIPQSIIRERISQSCELGQFVQVEGERKFRAKRPEKWLVEAIAHRGNYNGEIRPLAGIIQSPTIRPDGTILQVPGYDGQTGLFYRPSGPFPPIKDNPSREDAAAAVNALLEVVVDFPFKEAPPKNQWVRNVIVEVSISFG